MKNSFSVAIVGGGASGLMTAVELLSGDACFSGEQIVILERNDRVGKKLITTGNGQGNVSNTTLSCENYYGDFEFIKDFIENCRQVDLQNYFVKMGIFLFTAKDNKQYPLSKQAGTVVDIIRLYLESKGCTIMTDTKVDSVSKTAKGFSISTNNGEIFSKFLVMATGGKTAKQFGTDGSAYALIEKFGHSTTKLYPSLVQLKCDLQSIRGLKGQKETAKVVAIVNNKELKSATGEVLFTEYGVSGNAVFQVSGHFSGVENGILKVEFLPDRTFSEVENVIKEREKIPYLVGENKLLGLVNKKIGQAVIKSAKSLSAKDLAFALKNFNLKITGNLGFNYAQVTKGGIKTNAVDSKSYESKNVANMFIVGEMLNVDGDCGGYNLTFAFVSGITCAKKIKRLNEEQK